METNQINPANMLKNLSIQPNLVEKSKLDHIVKQCQSKSYPNKANNTIKNNNVPLLNLLSKSQEWKITYITTKKDKKDNCQQDIEIIQKNKSSSITQQQLEKEKSSSINICFIENIKESNDLKSLTTYLYHKTFDSVILKNILLGNEGIKGLLQSLNKVGLVNLSLIGCKLTKLDNVMEWCKDSKSLKYFNFSENLLTPIEIFHALKLMPNNTVLIDFSHQKTRRLTWELTRETLENYLNEYLINQSKPIIILTGNHVKLNAEKANESIIAMSLWESCIKASIIMKKIHNKHLTQEIYSSLESISDEIDETIIQSYIFKYYREMITAWTTNEISSLKIIHPNVLKIQEYFRAFSNPFQQTPINDTMNMTNLSIYYPFYNHTQKELAHFNNDVFCGLSLESQLMKLCEFLYKHHGYLYYHDQKANMFRLWIAYYTACKYSDISLAEFHIKYDLKIGIVNLHLSMTDDYMLPKNERSNRLAICNVDHLMIICGYLTNKNHPYGFYVSNDGYHSQNELRIRTDILFLKDMNISNELIYKIDQGMKIKKILEVEDIYQRDFTNAYSPLNFARDMHKKIKSKLGVMDQKIYDC